MFVWAACEAPTATGGGGNTPNPGVKPVLGVLGPGDVFEVNVYGEQEMSGTYRLSNDGSIDFPLVGRVQLEGLSSGQAQERLVTALQRFVRKPQVSIFVKEFNSQKVYVYGQVQKSGTFAYEQGMNVVQAVTLAGGFDKLADDGRVVITRRVDGDEQTFKVSVEDIGNGRVPNFELLPGDIVFVPESTF